MTEGNFNNSEAQKIMEDLLNATHTYIGKGITQAIGQV